jgi:hypothetical protein
MRGSRRIKPSSRHRVEGGLAARLIQISSEAGSASGECAGACARRFKFLRKPQGSAIAADAIREAAGGFSAFASRPAPGLSASSRQSTGNA